MVHALLFIVCGAMGASGFSNNKLLIPRTHHHDALIPSSIIITVLPTATARPSSPLDDFMDNLFGNNERKDEKSSPEYDTEEEDESDMNMSLSSFQQELRNRQTAAEEEDDDNSPESTTNKDDEEFDGYAFRDIIFEKYGECFDVDFQRVDSYGFRTVYLNIMPFVLGGRRFRHETEYDYLCHLQAVVEILVKYEQLDYVLAQLNETKKKPRAGTSPLVAVPLRLDLTPEQVEKILG